MPFTIGSPLATYCTAKQSPIGCVPTIDASNPTAQPVSGLGDYSVTANLLDAKRNGLLFAGTNGPSAQPFQGGFLCVQQPLKRGFVQNSGGTSVTCLGMFSTVVNDGTAFPAGFEPGPGNTAWYQYWYRVGGSFVGLSNAVQLDFQ